MTTKKRTVSDADLEPSISATKRRKINENDKDESASFHSIPLSTESSTESPSVNNINIDNDAKTQPQNDNTAKYNANKDTNSDPSKWSFTADGFTFGDNSWVRQSSDTKTTTDSNPQQTVINNTDSFSQYTGLGFQKVLENEESKQNDKAATDNAWGGMWSNSNPDGTFKLSFKWDNKWDKVDLNPSNSVGWGSTAQIYDDDIEEDDKTKQVLEQMTGEQDAGDTEDEVTYTVHCKIYNLDDGNYVERGNGMVKLNTYTVGKEKKLRGRILCRRDHTLTTLINAPILKEMKFEKMNSFIRFGVVEIKETEIDGNVKNEEVVKKEDDGDMMIKTYLLRPLDKSYLDILLNKIKEIQQDIA